VPRHPGDAPREWMHLRHAMAILESWHLSRTGQRALASASLKSLPTAGRPSRMSAPLQTAQSAGSPRQLQHDLTSQHTGSTLPSPRLSGAQKAHTTLQEEGQSSTGDPGVIIQPLLTLSHGGRGCVSTVISPASKLIRLPLSIRRAQRSASSRTAPAMGAVDHGLDWARARLSRSLTLKSSAP
jgi:hypothetical protein